MKSSEFLGENLDEAPAAQSQWGSHQEIIADVQRVLEREVEWPLTEIMDHNTVQKLLAPIRNALAQAQPQESAGGMGAASVAVAPVFGKHKPIKMT